VRKVLTLLSSMALLFSLAGTALAAPASDGMPAVRSDNLSSPMQEAQAAAREAALEAKLQGKAKAKGRALKAAGEDWVDFSCPVGSNSGACRGDRIFVVLAEFGTDIHASYGGDPGPLHNEIEAPDRSVDNTNIWQADYNRAHFQDMYFNVMKSYYKAQSSGRYTFEGEVVDWVKVPYNEARYGGNICGDNVCTNTWFLIRDAVNIWTQNQLDAGMSLAQIQAYLRQFDKWDRYDHDGDGNFDEPDGYIDHFQIVHAGEGEETGGGAQGTDAIWSHRWFTAFQGFESWGPADAQFGGMEIGGTGTYSEQGGPNATGLWVGDYTIQPENGGLGVFAHEYAHDLGLPDQYDTAGGENSTGFWTIMSSGSYIGNGKVDIGSKPNGFNGWEKFQLGWATYTVGQAGSTSSHKLGQFEKNQVGNGSWSTPQVLFVLLPDKPGELDLGDAYEGSAFFYSNAGPDLDNRMYKEFTLPSGTVDFSAQVRYHIETDWDYAYLTVSTDGGTNWTNIHTNLSTNTSPNGQNFGEGITGTQADWTTLTADLSAYADQTVLIGFRYWTDPFENPTGFEVDAIDISGQALEGAEEDPSSWTLEGFTVTDGSELSLHFNAYVAEWRQYKGYDAGLKTGPYNFGFLDEPDLQDWVEHFPYQEGLLISYWDESQEDNNTSVHPGEGLILPIDAHPEVEYRPDNAAVMRARVLAYDSTFSLSPTEAITLHFSSLPLTIGPKAAASVFDDSIQYWNPLSPLAGVKNPDTGTTIRIVQIKGDGNITLRVN
jgi:immune inhibitor A